jgi:hypothetical protein
VAETKPGFLTFTRIGFAARGLMYGLVAYLTLRLGREEDAGSALAYLGSGGGRAVLAVMALGFAAYGLWRLADAGLDLERRGREWKDLAVRAGGAVSGIVHLGLAFTAARLALGWSHGGGGSSRKAEGGAAMALHLPFGDWLLVVAAAICAGVAVGQFVKAARRRFVCHLRPDVRTRWWVLAAGCAGYAARGAVFATVAWLLYRSGTDRNAGEAGGLGDALRSLAGPLRLLVASGLGVFGAYCLIEAWFRILPDPAFKQRLKQAARR